MIKLLGAGLKPNNNVPHPCGISIFAYSIEDIHSLVSAVGQPAFRAKQLIEWLYVRNASSYDEMLNIPLSMREELTELAPLKRAELLLRKVSRDGTRKYLIRFADGALVETVGLPQTIKDEKSPQSSTKGESLIPSKRSRFTICVSSQVGCAMACSFCETGKGGFGRNLLPGEIVEQVRIASEDQGERASNIVVMGQGEPFANYDNTLAALYILNSKQAFNIGARHITVSTSGLINGIQRFADEPAQFTLAISLHSAIQATRDLLMPGLKNQTLPELSAALKNYYQRTGRRPSLEYALIEGPSSSEDEITALASFARTIGAHVNLIPINPSPSDKEKLRAPSKKRIDTIRKQLENAGVVATIRKSYGLDIAAACGQLLSLENER